MPGFEMPFLPVFLFVARAMVLQIEETWGDLTTQIFESPDVQITNLWLLRFVHYEHSEEELSLFSTDWFVWMPLYTSAGSLCCYHSLSVNRLSRGAAYVLLEGGVALFVKVVSQGCMQGSTFNWQEFVSLDMQKIEVKEKLGSVLVWLSMALQLDASGGLFPSTSKATKIPASFTTT